MTNIVRATLVMALLAAACSTRSPEAGAKPAPGAGTQASRTASAPGTASTPGATGSTAGTQASRAASAPGTASTLGAVVLDRTCARPGLDTQGLAGRTAPGATVGYSTTYADGSNELTNASYGGAGNGIVRADAAGRFRATWVVPATAPPGVATIRLIVSPKGSPMTPSVTYRVADGSCG